LAERAGLASRSVVNQLRLLAGLRKLPEADIQYLIEEGWGTEPVHLSPDTCKRIAATILVLFTPTATAPGAVQMRGKPLLIEVPEAQWKNP
jgi:hypothetical protein